MAALKKEKLDLQDKVTITVIRVDGTVEVYPPKKKTEEKKNDS